MRPVYPRTWSDDNLAQVKKLAKEGMSSAQIAVELGKTRNQVMGVISRYQIPLARRVSLVPMKELVRKPVPKPAPKPEAITPTARYWPKPMTATAVHIDKAQRFHCRMPLWDDDVRTGKVCGKPKLSDHSWCVGCAAIVYRAMPNAD